MEQCKNCGKEVQEGARFCKHCGSSVQSTDQETNEREIEKTEEIKEIKMKQENELSGLGNVTKPNTKPMSAKTKKLISVFVAAIVLFFIVYKVIESQNSYEKVIAGFDDAIKTKDVAKLKKYAFVNHDDLKITKETAKPLFDSYETNRLNQREYYQQLEHQGRQYEEYSASRFQVIETNQPFNLVPKKTLGIFKGYQVEISPVYVEVSTNSKNTKVYIGNKKESETTLKTINDREKLGPFLPGEIKVKGIIGNEVFELEKEEEISLYYPNDENAVRFYFDVNEVKFEKPFDRGVDKLSLLIDEKEIDHNILKDEIFSPLSIDGSLNYQLKAKFPWGEEVSKAYPIDSTLIDKGFRISGDLEKEIIDLIVKAETERLQFVASEGKEKPTIFTDDLDHEREIFNKTVYSRAYDVIDLRLKNLSFVENTFQLEEYEGDWYITVDTRSILDLAVYEQGDEAKYDEVKEEKTYTFKYNNDKKQWVVDELANTYLSMNANMIKYELENPIEFKTGDKVSNKKE